MGTVAPVGASPLPAEVQAKFEAVQRMNAPVALLSRLRALDNEQKLVALEDPRKCAIVRAGPGSGKTATMIARVGTMIAMGIDPCSITMLSFSRAAILELKDRLAALLGASIAGKINVRTYHAIALRICKGYIEEGLPDDAMSGEPALRPNRDFSIVTESRKGEIWSDLMRRHLRERAYDAAVKLGAVKHGVTVPSESAGMTMRAMLGVHAPLPTLDPRLFVDALRQRGEEQGEEDDEKPGQGHGEEEAKLCVFLACPDPAHGRREPLPKSVDSRRVMQEFNRQMKAAREVWRRVRLGGLDSIDCMESSDPFVTGCVGPLGSTYLCTLYEENFLEFEDAILFATSLLRNHEPARREFGPSLQYIIADEFQDTSGAQLSLLHELARCGRDVLFRVPRSSESASSTSLALPALMVVGDSKQAIYGFQGSVPAVFDHFRAAYPGCTCLLLNSCYRSSQRIIGTFNSIMSNVEQSRPAPNAAPGTRVLVIQCEDTQVEGHVVANMMADEKRRAGQAGKWSKFAILARNNNEVTQLSFMLWMAHIPFTRGWEKPGRRILRLVSFLAKSLLAVDSCLGVEAARARGWVQSVGLLGLDVEGMQVAGKYPFDSIVVPLEITVESAFTAWFIERVQARDPKTACPSFIGLNALRMMRMGQGSRLRNAGLHDPDDCLAILHELENESGRAKLGLDIRWADRRVPMLTAMLALGCVAEAMVECAAEWNAAGKVIKRRKVVTGAGAAAASGAGTVDPDLVRRWKHACMKVKNVGERVGKWAKVIAHAARDNQPLPAMAMFLLSEQANSMDKGASVRALGVMPSSSADPLVESEFRHRMDYYNKPLPGRRRTGAGALASVLVRLESHPSGKWVEGEMHPPCPPTLRPLGAAAGPGPVAPMGRPHSTMAQNRIQPPENITIMRFIEAEAEVFDKQWSAARSAEMAHAQKAASSSGNVGTSGAPLHALFQSAARAPPPPPAPLSRGSGPGHASRRAAFAEHLIAVLGDSETPILSDTGATVAAAQRSGATKKTVDTLRSLKASAELESDAVYVGTMHSAKGKEFDWVFAMRCNLFPSTRAGPGAVADGTQDDGEGQGLEMEEGEEEDAGQVGGGSSTAAGTRACAVDQTIAAFDADESQERCLFYVGASRPKVQLVLTEVKSGSAKSLGGLGGEGERLSPYLAELLARHTDGVRERTRVVHALQAKSPPNLKGRGGAVSGAASSAASTLWQPPHSLIRSVSITHTGEYGTLFPPHRHPSESDIGTDSSTGLAQSTRSSGLTTGSTSGVTGLQAWLGAPAPLGRAVTEPLTEEDDVVVVDDSDECQPRGKPDAVPAQAGAAHAVVEPPMWAGMDDW